MAKAKKTHKELNPTSYMYDIISEDIYGTKIKHNKRRISSLKRALDNAIKITNKYIADSDEQIFISNKMSTGYTVYKAYNGYDVVFTVYVEDSYK